MTRRKASAAASKELASDASVPEHTKSGEASCATPLDYMLGVMRDPEVGPARRDEMAKLALPYPKPTAIEPPGGQRADRDIRGIGTDIARRISAMR